MLSLETVHQSLRKLLLLSEVVSEMTYNVSSGTLTRANELHLR